MRLLDVTGVFLGYLFAVDSHCEAAFTCIEHEARSIRISSCDQPARNWFLSRFEEPEDDALDHTLDDDLSALVSLRRGTDVPDAGRITFGDMENLMTTREFTDTELQDGAGDVMAVIDGLKDDLLRVRREPCSPCFFFSRSQ